MYKNPRKYKKTPYVKRVQVRSPSDVLELFGEYELVSDDELRRVRLECLAIRDGVFGCFDVEVMSRLRAVNAVMKQREIACWNQTRSFG